MGYSLQANQKTREGATHPDRNAQFKFINARTEGDWPPAIQLSHVDTKKKEMVGDFKNPGRLMDPKATRESARARLQHP